MNGDNEKNEEFIPTDNKSLIAYRLGRVEKLVETIDSSSVTRDNAILAKIDGISKLSDTVNRNTYRLDTIESKFANFNRIMTGVIIAVVAIVAEIFFNII